MGKRNHTIEEFKKLAEDKGGKCLSSEFINFKHKLEFECSKGHRWYANPNAIINKGTWCKFCSSGNSYNIQDFHILAENKGGKCLSTEYKNCRTNLNFECDKGHVWDAAPRHVIDGTWCPKCGLQNGRKYEVDNNFFSNITEKSCYWAGFLAADGWVSRSVNGFCIGLQLCIKDIKHLEKFNKSLKSTYPIKFIERYTEKIANHKVNKILYSCSLKIHSEQIYSDLKKFGIFDRKTYYLRFPDLLRNHPFARHYLRGYIDGDGCFYEKNDKNQGNTICFDMKGTKEFLEECHNIFVENGICKINAKRKQLKAINGKKFAAFDTLRYGGNNQMLKMYNFLYNDATVFLERKEEIIKKVKFLVLDGGRKRKSRKSKFNITKEIMLEKIFEFKDEKKIAEYFGCSVANISWWINTLKVIIE